MNTQDVTYIFDFDKTIVSVESLELLAEIRFARYPNKKELLAQISTITEQGMNGEISFDESLRRRFALIAPTKQDINMCAEKLKKYVGLSFLRNKIFFKKFAQSIFIVSGGFKEFIIPTAIFLGIPESHIFANEIKQGMFDSSNPLAHENGKIIVVKSLMRNNIIVIGDGYTDAQIKVSGAAQYFIAFTEHITRTCVTNKADMVARSLDDIIDRPSSWTV